MGTNARSAREVCSRTCALFMGSAAAQASARSLLVGGSRCSSIAARERAAKRPAGHPNEWDRSALTGDCGLSTSPSMHRRPAQRRRPGRLSIEGPRERPSDHRLVGSRLTATCNKSRLVESRVSCLRACLALPLVRDSVRPVCPAQSPSDTSEPLYRSVSLLYRSCCIVAWKRP